MSEQTNSILLENKYLTSEVFGKLIEVGCCKICSFRFSGETKADIFKELYQLVDEKRHLRMVDTNSDSGPKKAASNPCIACLGMLQPPICDKIIDKIVEAVDKEEYDNPTFNVAFSLPISFYLRAHAVLVFLVNNYPQYFKENFPLGLVTVGVKDAWKYIFAEIVANKINKTFSIDSDLRIQTDIQYEDDHSEISCLLEMYPDKFKEQKIKAKRLRKLKGPTHLFSRKNVESLLDVKERDHFTQHYPVPPVIPTYAVICNNVFFEQGYIYVGGRYNKYMRGLPQTAWLVQDERKMETSVHELIADKIQALTKAQGSKFISSGREDVDVRMLGSGRPFALELLSPRHVRLSPEELKHLEHQINTGSAGRIQVHHLKLLPKSDLEKLKQGEEQKTKTYMAYCVVWNVDTNKLEKVDQLAPLTLKQKTPVRVLHRRPIATRLRTVHWMKVHDVKHSSDEGKTYFKLTLNTQAGTYIKEFIHGDFGRTEPSLGDLLGGVTADCLALDVESIHLEWPSQ